MHLESQCKKYPNRLSKGQQLLSFEIKKEGRIMLKNHSFNVEECRNALAKFVIVDEMPFRVVEGEGFVEYSRTLEPRFTIPSKWTVARECMKLYEEEKEKLKGLIKDRRICLTTDCWTSIQNINYMCLTGHWIDDDWKLHKRILNFRQVTSHKGRVLGKEIELCLLDWGVDKILTLTVDNASSNNLCIEYLKEKTINWKSTICSNDFLHVRCCAHILNLVVKNGLAKENDCIVKIRNVVRYVRSSPSRSALFQKCIEKEKIESKSLLCLDVDTRWNSTYLMLEAAIKFEQAFGILMEDDASFKSYFDGKKVVGPPSDEDWKRARFFVKFLRMFYDFTLKFSGSLFVTSNTSFREIVNLHDRLTYMCSSDDEFVRDMATSMKSKYDQYWGSYEKMNYLLFIVVILDPRRKMKYVSFCLRSLFDYAKVSEIIGKVEVALYAMYSFYEKFPVKNATSDVNRDFSMKSYSQMEEDDEDETGVDKWALQRDKMFKDEVLAEESVETKSELSRYLAERIEDRDGDSFDILEWWKVNSSRYPCLSEMAKAVLAIPVSTVSSESAFSTGGRVLTPYRSSLKPKTVEALICTQNWLRHPKAPIDLGEIISEIDKYEDIAQGKYNFLLSILV